MVQSHFDKLQAYIDTAVLLPSAVAIQNTSLHIVIDSILYPLCYKNLVDMRISIFVRIIEAASKAGQTLA